MAQASGNDRAHAQYAPSAAKRWMTCAASVKATLGMTSLSSSYAAEGTVAHHVLEGALLDESFNASKWIGRIIDVEIEGKPGSIIVTKEMAEAVQVCLDYVRSIVHSADDWKPEQQVTLKLFGAPACYGTADFTAVVTVASRIIVVDYKHGAGVLVPVDDNPQLKIYGLGALLQIGPGAGVTHVQTTIVQPRIPHPLGPVRSATYTLAELMDFGADVLDAIDACEAPDPAFVPGEHCRWCGIEHSCVARATAIAQALPMSGASDVIPVTYTLKDMRQLTVEQQEALLFQIEALDVEGFVASLRTALHKYANDGGALTNYKLVPKRGSRVWTKEEKLVIAELKPFLERKKASMIDLYASEFKSPAEVEKVIGKGEAARAAMAKLTVSVSSGTNLVPISNPRNAALTTAEDEFDALTPD